MITRAGYDRFDRRAAECRRGLWGDTLQGSDGVRIECAVTAVRSRRQLDDAGFVYEHSFMARPLRAELASVPELGEVFVRASNGRAYKVAEVVDDGKSAEIPLGLTEQ